MHPFVLPNVLVSEQSTTHNISSVLPWGERFWTRVICIAYRKPGSQRIHCYCMSVYTEHSSKDSDLQQNTDSNFQTNSDCTVCIWKMVPKIRTNSDFMVHRFKDSDPQELYTKHGSKNSDTQQLQGTQFQRFGPIMTRWYRCTVSKIRTLSDYTVHGFKDSDPKQMFAEHGSKDSDTN